MNKTVQNDYNIGCKVLRGGNHDGVKEIQYYSSCCGATNWIHLSNPRSLSVVGIIPLFLTDYREPGMKAL